jgi:predicted Zn-dependent peptidase
MRDDDPADRVHDVFASTLFGDTPLGRPILGSITSITALRRAQIAGYYHRRYLPRDMVVAVAGNVDHAAVVRRVRTAFDSADGRGGYQPARRQDQSRPAPRATIVGEETEQANIVLGTQGISRFDDRRFTAGVLSAALGGGMSSRLFQRIREERGLAYSIYTFSNSYTETGQFGIYAGCQPGKADEVISLITGELAAVAEGGFTEAEVQRGKGQMRGAVVLGLEDSGSRMSRIGKSELVYGDVLGVDELISRIDAVTVADAADLAHDLLHRPRALSVVGPFGPHDFDGVV